MVFDCPVCGHKKNIPQTNADRIRAMSDEELAKMVKIGCPPDIERSCVGRICEQCWLDWLRQPVKDGDNE